MARSSCRLFAPPRPPLPHSRCLARSINSAIFSQLQMCSSSSSSSSSRSMNKVEISQIAKKSRRGVARAPSRRLISISTSSGGWQGQWSCDFLLTLRELQLADLAEDGQQDAQVLVSLCIQKHAGFGFSIAGRILTSFNRKCSCCFSSYCREIDSPFDVWVLPLARSTKPQLPEIGGSDPSVIYVKPGSEADLDSLIRDTIRLTTYAKDTCSESCGKTSVIWQYIDGKRDYDRRWSKLLELKNAM